MPGRRGDLRSSFHHPFHRRIKAHYAHAEAVSAASSAPSAPSAPKCHHREDLSLSPGLFGGGDLWRCLFDFALVSPFLSLPALSSSPTLRLSIPPCYSSTELGLHTS